MGLPLRGLASDQRPAGRVGIAACNLDEVLDRLLGAGLQLARITRDRSLRPDLRAELREVIESLDAAITELRGVGVVVQCSGSAVF